MRGHAVKNGSHFNFNFFAGNIRIKDFGAVWFGKDGVAYVPTHLTGINIEGSHYFNIASSVTIDLVVHEADAVFFIYSFIIFDSLD
ncbi:Uncharacterised protein [uncultured archaeon]|nr:Uncharacterised protein [uncultured archaeon]